MKRKPMTEQELNWLAGLLVDKMLTLFGHRIAGYTDQPTLLDIAQRGHRVMMRSSLPVVEALSQRNPLLKDVTVKGTWHKRMTAKQMHCRWPNCKARSRGPRFHYLCKKHSSKKR